MVFSPFLAIIPAIFGTATAAATTVAAAATAAAAAGAAAHIVARSTYTLEEKIEIVQNNIANMRKLSGLQTIQFAKMLQITKQALNNWETKKNKINFAQYVLLTNVFQSFVREYSKFPSIRCDEKTLEIIVSIIVFPEIYSKEEFKKYQETIIALADLSRNNTQVSTIFKALIKELPDSIPE